MKILLSVIIVTFQRTILLSNCLQSVKKSLQQLDSSQADFEILVISNGSDNQTASMIKKDFPEIEIMKSEKVSPGEARNKLISTAKGNFFCFLDDDVVVPLNYFAKGIEILNSSFDVDVLGGPDAVYPNPSIFESALAITLSSPIATATTRLRHSPHLLNKMCDAKENHLILCNLWFKSDIFTKQKFSFDARFFRNEENVLLHQLSKHNKRVYFSYDLFVHHKRKDNIIDLIKSVSKSGSFRLKSFFLFPDSTKMIYFMPLLFIIYLFTLPANHFWPPLLIYFVINVYFSVLLTWREGKIRYFPLVMFLQVVINISYGLGFFQRLLISLIKREFKEPSHV